MKPCPEYREAVALLAARTLDADTREKTERHLDSCQDCRGYFENLQRVCEPFERMSRDVSSAELPAGFHRRLLERVRADAEAEAPSPTVVDWLRSWFSWPRVSYLAAVAMVLVAALFWFVAQPGPREPRLALPGSIAVLRESTPAPTLMALSRALQESESALDSLLARQERLLAANDPPSAALGNAGNGVW